MNDRTEQLPARMRRLEEAALREFALTFGPRLHRLFLRRGLSVTDAEALAVSCVTDAVMKIGQFQPSGPDSLERWVYTLARRAWIADWRKRPQAQPLSSELAWPEHPDWDEAEPAVSRSVQEALSQLSETDRMIVQLHQLEELSFSEIGERLGIPEGTARVRHHRALQRLENVLQDDPVVRAWLQIAPTQKTERKEESHDGHPESVDG